MLDIVIKVGDVLDEPGDILFSPGNPWLNLSGGVSAGLRLRAGNQIQFIAQSG
jgi:hypothetical protein